MPCGDHGLLSVSTGIFCSSLFRRKWKMAVICRNDSRVWSAFLPISVIAKYGMALLVIGVTVRMSEWVEKKCSTILGAVAASLGTFALSILAGYLILETRSP